MNLKVVLEASDETFVDFAFPLVGSTLPLDHGYALFAATSGIVHLLHEEHSDPTEGGFSI